MRSRKSRRKEPLLPLVIVPFCDKDTFAYDHGQFIPGFSWLGIVVRFSHQDVVEGNWVCENQTISAEKVAESENTPKFALPFPHDEAGFVVEADQIDLMHDSAQIDTLFEHAHVAEVSG